MRHHPSRALRSARCPGGTVACRSSRVCAIAASNAGLLTITTSLRSHALRSLSGYHAPLIAIATRKNYSGLRQANT